MAEIAYYLDHHLEGSDRERLERLRDRCAEEMRRALELPELDHATARRAMLGALEFRPTRTCVPALARAARARPDRRDRQQLGLLAAGVARPGGHPRAGGRRGHLGRGGRAEAEPARVRARACDRGRRARPRRCTWATRSTTTWRVPRAAGVRGVLLQREGDPPAGVEAISLASGARPPYSDWPWSTLTIDPTPPPPERPELPEGAEPRWPAWYAGVGFLVALIADAHRRGHRRRGHGGQHRRREPDLHGGRHLPPGRDLHRDRRACSRRSPRKPTAAAIRAAPDALLADGRLGGARDCSPSTLLAALYTAIVQPDAEQTVAQDLGADQGTLGPDRGRLHDHLRRADRGGVLLPRLLLPRAAQPLLDARGGADRRPPVRRDPLRLLERRCAPDRAAAGGARVHVLPCLRAHRARSIP